MQVCQNLHQVVVAHDYTTRSSVEDAVNTVFIDMATNMLSHCHHCELTLSSFLLVMNWAMTCWSSTDIERPNGRLGHT